MAGRRINAYDFVRNIDGMLKYEQPNSDLYSFEGSLKLSTFPAQREILTENLALRGFKLKNTTKVYGLVLNAGNDNKCVYSENQTRMLQARESNKIINIALRVLYVMLAVVLCSTIVSVLI